MDQYTIAAFDFDNTITTKDSLFDFIKKSFGYKKFLGGLIITSPLFVLNLLRLLSNHRLKEGFLGYYLKKMPVGEFRVLCDNYKTEVQKIVNLDALEKINWHIQQNHTVLIISASIEDWIYPWANSNGIHKVIGTQLEVSENRLTGRFSSLNCNGSQKVERLLSEYPNRKDFKLFVYGDSEGDKQLLEEADFKYYRTF